MVLNMEYCMKNLQSIHYRTMQHLNLNVKILKNKNAIIFRLGTLFGVSDNYSRIRMDLVVNTLSAKAFLKKKCLYLEENNSDRYYMLRMLQRAY